MESTELAKMVHQAKGNQEVLQLLIEKFQPLINGSRANFFCIYPNRLKIKGCRLDFGRPEKIF